MYLSNIRFPDTTSLGIKPVSREGTERLVRAALDTALKQGRKTLTLVHKGNIMKFTEGAFRDWGYDVARREYGAEDLDGGPWQIIRKNGNELIVNPPPHGAVILKSEMTILIAKSILASVDSSSPISTLVAAVSFIKNLTAFR